MHDDYGNFISNSASLALGSKRNGSIEVVRDQDVFAVNLTAGFSVTFEAARLASAASGGLADPYLVLLDATGKELASDDEGFGSGNARLHYSVPTTGTYYLAVFDNDNGIGTYSVGAYRRIILPTSNFDDILTGSNSPDTFLMGRGNDSCRGNGGDDLLDGGEGLDTITYAGPAANHSIERVPVGAGQRPPRLALSSATKWARKAATPWWMSNAFVSPTRAWRWTCRAMPAPRSRSSAPCSAKRP